MQVDESIGEWMKRRRKALDLTQQELADRVGCSLITIAKIETGMRRPSRQMALLLAEHLQIGESQKEQFVRSIRMEGLPPPPQLAALEQAAFPANKPQKIPASPTQMVGRERELTTVRQRLSDPSCRFLTLTGPGGVGKTRLALEVASLADVEEWRVANDGVFFIQLAGLQSPDLLMPAIAAHLGVVFSPSADPGLQLSKYFANQAVLLILDNFEHIRKAAILVLNLLSQTSNLKVLVTSRISLDLQSEWVIEIGGLDFPESSDTQDILGYHAVSLFVQRAGQIKPGFQLRETDLDPVVRICRFLHGLPLGLELAAAWVRYLSIEEIATEIENGLDFLQSARPEHPPRQRSLRSVIDYSWGLLGGEEQRVLRQLAMFQGGFELSAARAVSGASLGTMAELVNHSLLFMDANNRYSLHDYIRQFALEHLTTDVPEEQGLALQRYSQHYLENLIRLTPVLQGSTQRQGCRAIEDQFANISAAWEWAVRRAAAGNRDAAQLCSQALWPLWYYLDLNNRYISGEYLLRHSIEMLSQDRQTALRAQLLLYQAAFLFRMGENTLAKQYLQESLEHLRLEQEITHRVDGLRFLAVVEWFTGSLQQSQQLLEESWELCRADNQLQWQAAYAACLLGILLHEQGQYSQAGGWLKQGLERSHHLGDPQLLSFSSNFYIRTANVIGEMAESDPKVRAGLLLTIDMQDRFMLGLVLEQLLQSTNPVPVTAEAHQLFAESVEMYLHSTDPWGLSRTMTLLGRYHLANTNWTDAHSYFTEALETAYGAGLIPVALDALAGLAILSGLLGQVEQAVNLLACITAHPASSFATRQWVNQWLERPALSEVKAAVDLIDQAAPNRSLNDCIHQQRA